VPSVGNFLIIRFPDKPGRTARDADAFLSRRGILLRRIEAYGLPDYLRMTVGTGKENRAVVECLREFIELG
jgi:histidinol-phosphate aminotransferase